MPELLCQTCGAPVTREEPIGRDATCEGCGRDLCACRNCRHWNARFHGECTETQAEFVADKTRRNFCEFFYFSRAACTAGAGTRKRPAPEWGRPLVR